VGEIRGHINSHKGGNAAQKRPSYAKMGAKFACGGEKNGAGDLIKTSLKRPAENWAQKVEKSELTGRPTVGNQF